MRHLLELSGAHFPIILAGIIIAGLLLMSRHRPSWYTRALAIFALALFATFLAVLATWVEGIDIKVVILITVGLAAYDFWRDAFSEKNSGRRD